MRHLNGLDKMGRDSGHRVATLRNLATALFTNDRITTTKRKARAVRPWAERLITLAKRGDLHARRLAARDIHDHGALQKLFGELAERFRTRPGGYTRLLKLGRRRGDNGMEAMLELVDSKPVVSQQAAPAPAKTAKAPKAEAKAEKPAEAEAPEVAETEEAEAEGEAPAAKKKAPKKAAKPAAKSAKAAKKSAAKSSKSSGKKSKSK
jgi:large subunit ribosomal protein L17